MTEVTAKDGTKWFCSKGMVDVILKTNPDDEGKQWTVNNYDEMSKQAHKADADLGIAGGIFPSPQMQPRLQDVRRGSVQERRPHGIRRHSAHHGPPKTRHQRDYPQDQGVSGRCEDDYRLRSFHGSWLLRLLAFACAGDHHNIGKELARQIDLGTDIRTPDCLQPPSEARDLIAPLQAVQKPLKLPRFSRRTALPR